MRAAADALPILLLLASPLAAEVELEPVGRLAGPVDQVRATGGDLLYLAAGKTVSVVDVSEPAAPVVRGSYTFPEQVWGFRIEGERAYVGANFFGLGILDLSDPAAPALLGRLQTLGQAKVGAVYGKTVAVIDHMDGVVLGDLSDETAPRLMESFFVDGYGRDVASDGPLAYAVDSPAGLYVFDLSAGEPQEPIGVLQEPGMPRSIEVVKSRDGRTLLVGPAGGDLRIYDVSTPAAPRSIATFTTPGRAHRVAADGPLVFVADGAEGVLVLDLTVPESPRVAGSYESRRPARGIGAGPSLVFVVEGESEVEGDDRSLEILRRSVR